MNTETLIARLASEAAEPKPAPSRALAVATIAGVVAAGTLMAIAFGFRPDFASALASPRFLFKFVVTLCVALTAFLVLKANIYPETVRPRRLPLLWIAPVLLLGAALLEMCILPSSQWAQAAQGKNALMCLSIVPALGLAPLALAIWAVRTAAPPNPGLAGYCAGLLAGGIAASFYAANCTDDSPLFVLTWYPLAVLALGLLGAVLGRVFARW